VVLIAGFPAGPWGTNCYVVATAPGAECVVIDPGMEATAGVAEVVRQHRLKPVSVLVTHGHVDHMWCVAPVAGERWGEGQECVGGWVREWGWEARIRCQRVSRAPAARS